MFDKTQMILMMKASISNNRISRLEEYNKTQNRNVLVLQIKKQPFTTCLPFKGMVSLKLT